MSICHACGPAGNSLYTCDACREAFISRPPFSDQYTGPRWKYGYINRPFAMAHQPRGFILMTYNPDERVEIGGKRSRHGTIEYPFQLTDDEVYGFELFLVEVKNASN